jgi:two-component system LytT family sensor kinase
MSLLRYALWFALVGLVVLFAGVVRYAIRGGRQMETPGQRATYEALHRANLAAPALRGGLVREGLERAAGQLRSLLGARGLVVADQDGIIASDNVDDNHAALLIRSVQEVMKTGRPAVLSDRDLACGVGTCQLATGVVVPLQVDGVAVGALGVLDTAASAGLLRLSGEVAQFVSTQLELAELDQSRQRAAQAELQLLRAQISPHFIYNALTAIESFVRSDPDRARELLVAFADFTRYSFRSHGQFTTLADELRLVDIYLDLERARFGDRFDVTLRVAPEVLSVRVPSLILQPIVENAIRHGLEPTHRGRLRIDVTDEDSEACLTVEDDGVGADPTRVMRILSGTGYDDSVGLRNVDERLRATFGHDHGLRIETARGAGTRVTMRIPKFHAGVGAA